MGCSCNKKKEQFAVVTQNGSGRQVFASSAKATAISVSKKYPNSVVKDGAGAVVHTNAPAAAAPAAAVGGPNEVAE